MWKTIKKHKLLASVITIISLLALLAGVGYAMNTSTISANEENEQTETADNADNTINSGVFAEEFLSMDIASRLAEASDADIPHLASAIRFVDTATFYRGGLALDDQGKVWAWGYNTGDNYGAPGISDSTQTYLGGMRRLPYFVENNIKVVKIYASYATCYALDDQGNLYAWGNGMQGQMGNGTTTAANYAPIKVAFFSNLGEKVTYVCASTTGTMPSFTYVQTESGKVYAWGYAPENRIPGYAGYQSTPVRMPAWEGIDIAKISMGTSHGVILDTSGNVYIWGNATYGKMGQGNATTAYTVPTKMTQFAEGSVKDISAAGDKTLALTNDGKVYQWGLIQTGGGGGGVGVTSPTVVGVDASTATYTPQPKSVFAGVFASYFVDNYGRPWVWGSNNYYQSGADGPLPEKLNTFSAVARQLPQTLGDGDTQGVNGVVKAPVFSGASSAQTAAYNSYRRFGQWSSLGDGLHPTIYDKKYSKTVGDPLTSGTNTTGQRHDKVYLVDKYGRRVIYVMRRDANGTYSGNYYVAEDSYTGSWIVNNGTTSGAALPSGITEVTSVPSIKDEERNWIGLAVGDVDNFDFTGNNLQPMPYVSTMSNFQSSVTFLDPSGNLYRTSLDGSGTVAWGWDYGVYEDGTAGNNTANGLYNMYTYEVMYMRGAPQVNPGSISVVSEKEKIYTSQNKSQNVELKISLGEAYYDSSLDFTVEPELKNVKYIIMPYDVDDPNMTAEEPTADEFNAAFASAGTSGYTAVDLIAQNGWQGIKQEVGADPIELTDDSITISENSVIWMLIETNAYSASQTVVKTVTYDNFYTDAEINHKGTEYGGTAEVYAENSSNITKLTADGIDDLVGFPVDKNGKIMGTVAEPPTYGYDEVQVSKLTDTQLDAISTSIRKAWIWHTPQADSKTFTLNGVDADNADDPTAATGELAVTDKYTHQFYYDENPAAFAQVQYVGVDKNGNRISEFSMTPNPEKLMKEVDYTRTPPTLSAASGYVATKYKVIYTTPSGDPIDISGASALASDGSVSFNIPWDDSITNVTVIFVYEQAPMAYYISADRGVSPYAAVTGFVDENTRTPEGAVVTHEPNDAAIDSEYAIVGYKIFNGKVTDVSTLDLTTAVQSLNSGGEAEYTPPSGQDEYTVVYIYEKAPLVHYVAADKGAASDNLLTDFSMNSERLAKDTTHSKTPVYSNDDYVMVGYKVISGELAAGATDTDISGYTSTESGAASFKPSDYGYELTVIFVYEKKTIVNFVGINGQDADNLVFMDGWDIASRKEVKGSSNTQAPKDYTLPDGYKAIGYYVVNGQVTDPTTVDLDQLGPLNAAGNAAYTVPSNQDEITIIFVYEIPPSVAQLHVRQVIVDSNTKVKVPTAGYMTLTEGKPGTSWTFTDKEMNITTTSRKESQSAKYSDYVLPISKDYMGYGLTWITPQYYEYKGYKISSVNGEYDSTGMNTSKDIQIDFTDDTEYWVTIYLAPVTDNPGNYSWKDALNDFGKILIP
ncbi:RCC1 domain-containing protein [Enterococcus larvae]|uniref:RCC1 domain-containing protein n=1 Tax=Enterococcus larvae TaxID=2794352 RepID=UPI003F3FCEE5